MKYKICRSKYQHDNIILPKSVAEERKQTQGTFTKIPKLIIGKVCVSVTNRFQHCFIRLSKFYIRYSTHK